MKHFLITLAFTAMSISYIQAQFGISGYYSLVNSQEDAYTLNDEKANITGNGYAVGVDYWFRLKNKRIEFTPEINFSQHNLQVDFTNVLAGDLKETKYSLFLNTNIYPFDFNTDCDCPTFSKQNDTFKKGFFIQLSPQATYRESSYQDNLSQDDITFGGALGIGLDIGITKLITVTPIVRYNYHFGINMVDWSDADTPLTVNESNRGTVTVGLRFGVRFDGRRF